MSCTTKVGRVSEASNGYANVYDSVSKKNVKAHRFVYEKAHGLIPKGFVVMHTCNNRGCTNLEHLVLGTQSENLKDMYNKGRQGDRDFPKGESHHFTTLTKEEVEELKATPYYRGLFSQWAKTHGVTRQTARNIYRGKTWKNE